MAPPGRRDPRPLCRLVRAGAWPGALAGAAPAVPPGAAGSRAGCAPGWRQRTPGGSRRDPGCRSQRAVLCVLQVLAAVVLLSWGFVLYGARVAAWRQLESGLPAQGLP